MKQPKKYLALDVGTVRIGIAISDPTTNIALPLSTVHVAQSDNPCADIKKIIDENQIQTVVVGWPLELDGSEGPAIRRTKQFLVSLKNLCPGIRIIPQDERLSSSAAENSLQMLQTKGSNKKNLVDAMATAIILQAYLDSKKT